jgi:CheY-like chemotaxis protein
MSKRILVVEDQPDNRQIIRDMLAPTDYEITEAEDGGTSAAGYRKAAGEPRVASHPNTPAHVCDGSSATEIRCSHRVRFAPDSDQTADMMLRRQYKRTSLIRSISGFSLPHR